MITAIYRIAGLDMEISTLHEDVHLLCSEYLCPGGQPCVTVRISREDIDLEREKSAKAELPEGRRPGNCGDGYLETLAVYRRIAEQLPAYDTFLFHGSCVAVDNEGYLFAAPSGTGKSTHARLWRKLLPDRAVMVNDDKPLIRAAGSGVTVFGTPWDGKHRLSSNIAVPLRAVCILERAAENHIETITAAEAYPLLLRQTYRPADPEAMTKTLALISRMASQVKLCRLGCNMEPEAAETAYRFMSV